MTYRTICSERDDRGICDIRLNRPERLNAMNAELVREVGEAFRAAQADGDTRVILFSGAGRAFCAGDDRDAHTHPQSEAEARAFVDSIQQVTREIALGRKPVIGAIQGWAVGGGFEWALNCDFSIWARDCRAFFPEVSLNLCVTGAATALLPAMVGLNKAREMLFFGERYTAGELHDLGIAWRVVDAAELMPEARALALRLAALPAASLQATKSVLNRVGTGSLEQALQLETEATVAAFLDPETTRLLKDF